VGLRCVGGFERSQDVGALPQVAAVTVRAGRQRGQGRLQVGTVPSEQFGGLSVRQFVVVAGANSSANACEMNASTRPASTKIASCCDPMRSSGRSESPRFAASDPHVRRRHASR
jgi:hypothetical protein